MTKTTQDMEREAQELSRTWVLVGTNQGTYGGTEAVRAVGCGDPAFADCNIYEQVGTGKRRVDGPDPDSAPGYIRRFTSQLAAKQRTLRGLREEIKASL